MIIAYRWSRIAYLAAVSCVAGSTLGAAQQINIAGSWSGSGVVKLPSGASESVRCRATFTQVGSGARMSATCASPSTRVSQTAELSRVSGTRFVGDFNNPEYNISGSIRIILSGSNSMSASLSGGGGSATINLSR